MNVNEMVGRLRKGAGDECGGCCYLEDMLQAADMLAELSAQVEGLENKCALLAASWKKAEDELEKIRAALVKTSR
jgi:hypothetical protein